MIHYARKQRQLKNLAHRIADEVAANGGALTRRAAEWLRQLKRGYAALRGMLSGAAMRQLAFVLSATLSAGAVVHAQSFADPVTNPYGLTGLPWGDASIGFAFVDLDDDGDYDLVSREFGLGSIYEVHLAFHVNTGSASSPEFAAPEEGLFGTPTMQGFEYWETYNGVALTAADLDGDGDFDLIAHAIYGYAENEQTEQDFEWYSPVLFLENTGTPSAPEFNSMEANPFGLDLAPGYSSSWNALAFADLDADGDLDLLGARSSGYYSDIEVIHCENVGSATAPDFLPPELGPFGLPDTIVSEFEGIAPAVDIADLDQDGDLDFVVSVADGNYYNGGVSGLLFYENEGSPDSPAFAAAVTSPFGLQLSQFGGLAITQFCDLDGDGDLDAIHNDNSPNGVYGPNVFVYQENTAPVSMQELFSTERAQILPNAVRAGDSPWVYAPWSGQSPIEYEVRDLSGRIVASGKAVESFQLNTSGWSAGHYLIRLMDPISHHHALGRLTVHGR